MKVLASPAFSNRSWNPYCSLLYEAMQREGVEVMEFDWNRCLRGKCDILHIHWPDLTLNDRSWRRAFLKGTRLLLSIWWTRLRGARLVWTAHNLLSHENYHPRLERFFWAALMRQLDGVISLSQAGLAEVREKKLGHRSVSSAVVALGHFRDVYPNEVSRGNARRHFNIDPSSPLVAGWIGQIRSYKGLPELVAAWQSCQGEKKVLLIAGYSPEAALRQMLEETAAQDSSIQFCHGRVEDSDMQWYLNASDVLIMPYRKILNSASALLALSFHRPVVLPRSKSMTELQKQVGHDWIYLYDGKFNENVLRDVFQWMEQRPKLDTLALDGLDWDFLGRQTIQFFKEVLAAKS